MSDVVRRRLLVSGRVQGVWYRASAEREAARLGVGGFARNLDDGRVELFVEGMPDAVDAFIAWARIGPPRAEVAGVVVEGVTPVGERAFYAR
jgi:acylphosphatase